MNEFHFEITDTSTQRVFLEQFRLYGTREDRFHLGRDTTHTLTLWYALRAGEFFLTSARIETIPGTKRDLQCEYIITGKDCAGLIQCRIPQHFERVGEGGRWHPHTPEIDGIDGTVPCTKEFLTEMIHFYAKHQTDWEQQYHYRERCSRHFMTRRDRICEHPELWKNELLIHDYQFITLTKQEQAQLKECAKGTYPIGATERFSYAMTDTNRRFLMTLSRFMADGIKHCGEPDDYEYAIVTGSEMGIVYIWHPYNPEIRGIEGNIPLPKEELKEMIRYYYAFHHDWQAVLRLREERKR